MYDIKTENRFWSKILTGGEDECWECAGMRLNECGYGVFDEKTHYTLAHRFSFQLHHKQLIKDKMCIMHICDNRLCVNPYHLKEGTWAQNNADMCNKGRGVIPKGEKHGNSKLTNAQVLEIRKEYTNTKITQKNLAQQYSVSEDTIRKIINNKTWKHLPP